MSTHNEAKYPTTLDEARAVALPILTAKLPAVSVEVLVQAEGSARPVSVWITRDLACHYQNPHAS